MQHAQALYWPNIFSNIFIRHSSIMKNMIKIWLTLLAVSAGISDVYCSESSSSGTVVRSWGKPVKVYSSRHLPSSREETEYYRPLATSYSEDTSESDQAPENLQGRSVSQLSLDINDLNPNGTNVMPMSRRFVPKIVYDIDHEYNKTLANRTLYYKDNNISDSNLYQQTNGTFNDTSVMGRGGRCPGCHSGCSSCQKPNSCDCVPIHPEMKDFKWSAGKHCVNLEANINLLFKEDKYWCRIKTIIKNAIEEALSNRCTLCAHEFGSSY